MNICIPKALFQSHEKILTKKPFEMDGDKLKWHDNVDADLSRYDAKALEKLAMMFDETPDIRGAKTLARDIRSWLQACESFKGAGKVRCRSVRQATPLLIQYLGRLPRHHVYQRIQEGNEGVVLAYFVYGIEFTPRNRDEPEKVRIKLAYEEFGLVEKSSVTLYPKDVVGLTPHTILVNCGLLPETEQLHEDYLFFLEQYVAWKDLVGTQFLAVGLADDQGIDGNENESESGWWRSSRSSKFILDRNGIPARVVIDIFREESKDRHERSESFNTWFWKNNFKILEDGEVELEDVDEEHEETEKSREAIEVPVHPYVATFDLTRHKRLRIHVGNLTPYKYNTTIRERLVLPDRHSRLIDTLLGNDRKQFQDVIANKSGGTIILCQGKPGTGKTLTAEVYSETLERPLYSVQCSQLGTDPSELEDALLKVLARGRRWNAVMLLDEADVYVHARGSDLQQNAIVGVFLRVLEYHAGVLFLTTNRADLVDDAILSRCTARIKYDVPSIEDQARIWDIIAKANETMLGKTVIQNIVAAFPRLSGRDIKNLLKLALMSRPDGPIDVDLIAEVKEFKPTSEET